MKELASKEMKMTFDKFFRDSYVSKGMFVIRFASKLEMTPSRVVDAVHSHLVNEVNARMRNNGNTPAEIEEIKQSVDFALDNPIIAVSTKTFTIDADTIYYYQIVLDTTRLMIETTRPAMRAASLERHLYDYVFHSYDRNWLLPTITTTDFIYSISNVDTIDVPPLKICNQDETLLKARDIIFKPENDMAFAFEADTTKSYNRHAVLKYTIKVYQDLADAFEEKTKKTLVINQMDSYYGRMLFVNTRCDRNGADTIVPIYDNKPKMEWYKDMAIFYDGDKSFNSMRPYFDLCHKIGIKQLNILQFCGNKDFFYQEFNNTGIPIKKAVFIFINTNRIAPHRSNINVSRGGISGSISYSPAKGRRTTIDTNLSSGMRIGSNYYGTFVVPVSHDGDCSKGLEALAEIMDNLYNYIELGHGHNMDNTAAGIKYKAALFGEDQAAEPDTLSEWFKYCTRASRQNDNGIILAYEKMKLSLEKEYNDLKKYLDHYDFSKCLPVPVIRPDEKMIKNYYKSLHIEPQNVIMNSVNNKKIDAFEEIKPIVTFMIINQSRGIIKNRQYDLSKFYNAKDNSITFDYNKMRGEVNRDKTQNRR